MFCLFSSKSFIVSGLTFRSLINFEFIFVYGVRKYSNVIFLHVAVQFSQHHLSKSLFLTHCMFLPPLSKIRYHLTPIRMAAIKVYKQQMLERVWRKGNPLTLLVRMQTSTAIILKFLFVLPKGKTEPFLSSNKICYLLNTEYMQTK